MRVLDRKWAHLSLLSGTTVMLYKMGSVFPIIIWSEFRLEQYRDEDHREDAPRFTFWMTSIKPWPEQEWEGWKLNKQSWTTFWIRLTSKDCYKKWDRLQLIFWSQKIQRTRNIGNKIFRLGFEVSKIDQLKRSLIQGMDGFLFFDQNSQIMKIDFLKMNLKS